MSEELRSYLQRRQILKGMVSLTLVGLTTACGGGSSSSTVVASDD